MRPGNSLRRSSLWVALRTVLSVGLLSGGGEPLIGIGPGEGVSTQRVFLAKYGSPVAVMGQLTLNAEPIEGTFFFLFYDPMESNAKEQCGLQQEHWFPEGSVANGAQVAFIPHPNAIVTFTIAPSQFVRGYLYNLPFLPEGPPGEGALESF